MYKFILCMCIGCLFFTNSSFAQIKLLEQKVSVDKKAATIQDVLTHLSIKYNINFSYSKDLVSLQQKVTVKATELPLSEVLDNLFRDKGIQYILIGNQIALQKIRKKKSGYTISGYVTDSASGEALAGAYINSGTAQTSSNAYGFYSLLLPTDKINLEVRYLGYSSLRLQIPAISQDTMLALHLKRLNGELAEVIIHSESTTALHHANKVSMSSSEIKQLPPFMGEADAIKAFQLMPGVQGREGSSDLIVRGGSPDQNLILLDGVPVYNVSHLLGIFSVFNPDAIRKVDMIKGGFPAPYGGRLSSVVDIYLKEGNNKKFVGEGSLGLISSKLLLEGPIKNEKTSFLIAARRTYLDLITAVMGKNNNSYNFSDINAKVNHTFSPTDRVYLSVYGGRDKFVFRDKDYNEMKYKMKWGNTTGALRWNHIYNPRLFSNVTLTHSNYSFDQASELRMFESGININRDASLTSSINDWGAKTDFDFVADNKHHIRFGGSYIYHQFNPESVTITADSLNFSSASFSKISAHEIYTYAEDRISINDNLQAIGGVHISAFAVEGKNYTSIQPRLALGYTLPKGPSLQASFSTMTQYLHLLSNTSTGSPTDVWAPATRNVKPQRSWQATLGTAASFIQDKYEFNVDFYYKKMRDVAEFKDGSDFVGDFLRVGPEEINLTSLIVPPYEERITTGEGWSYGSEWMLRKKAGKTSGWIGYTLSYATRQLDGINENKPYPYAYDSRHSAVFVINQKLTKKLSVGVNWTYRSGYVTTLPTASYKAYKEPNQYDYQYTGYSNIDYLNERNNYRLPSYHRMDVSLTNIKKKRWGERTWNISVYNVYNRMNPYLVQISPSPSYQSSNARTLDKVVLFPIIPSFSYGFKF